MNEALVASHSCTFELRMNNEQRTMNNELFASLPIASLPCCLVAYSSERTRVRRNWV